MWAGLPLAALSVAGLLIKVPGARRPILPIALVLIMVVWVGLPTEITKLRPGEVERTWAFVYPVMAAVVGVVVDRWKRGKGRWSGAIVAGLVLLSVVLQSLWTTCNRASAAATPRVDPAEVVVPESLVLAVHVADSQAIVGTNLPGELQPHRLACLQRESADDVVVGDQTAPGAVRNPLATPGRVEFPSFTTWPTARSASQTRRSAPWQVRTFGLG